MLITFLMERMRLNFSWLLPTISGYSMLQTQLKLPMYTICQGVDLQLCIKSCGSELIVLYTLIFFSLGNKEESKKSL